MDLYAQFIDTLVQYQFEINRYITSSIRTAKTEGNLYNSAIVIGIAFLYGLIHAAGPGHGKALISFYFSTNKSDYTGALKLGYLISIVHALSAIVSTFVIFFIISTMFRQNFNDYSNLSIKISSALIILVGLYIIISSYISRFKRDEDIPKNKSKYALAIGAGIVPCPGVMTIVLFCIMLKQYVLGILAAISMSIGMGLTISVVGILSIMLNKKANSFINQKAYILEILGGLLIILLGAFLFYSTIITSP